MNLNAATHIRPALLATAIILATLCRPPSGRAKDNDAVQFRAQDLVLNSGTNQLAAYQVELTYEAKTVTIVGLEGGDGVYTNAPYYDRKGFTGGRIIVASFITKHQDAPSGETRVARVHLAVTKGTDPVLSIRVTAAATPGGTKIIPSAKLTAARKED